MKDKPTQDRPINPPLDQSPLEPEVPIVHKRDPEPSAYDEVNVDASRQAITMPKMRKTTNAVAEKQHEEENLGTPPAPPDTMDDEKSS